jgi:hypothetical protein
MNSDFIKAVRVLYVLKIRLRNSLQVFNQVESPNNFCFYFLVLFGKEFLKVVFVERYFSMFLVIVHLDGCENKVTKVSLK